MSPDQLLLEQHALANVPEASIKDIKDIPKSMRKYKILLTGSDRGIWGFVDPEPNNDTEANVVSEADALESGNFPTKPSDTYARDLICLRGRSEAPDTFSHFIKTNIDTIYEIMFSKRLEEDPLTGYSQISLDQVYMFTSFISAIVAPVFLISSIAILYSVKSMHLRLGMVAVFSTLFSICLGVFTNAKRLEVFVAIST